MNYISLMKSRICDICMCYMDDHKEFHWLMSCSCGFRKQKVTIFMTNYKEIISLDQYLMGRDKTHKDEYNQSIMDNSRDLLRIVNHLLQELNIETAKVSSGWRPPSFNSTVQNAAKKSLHMSGKAIDILDDENQTLGKLILSKPELLKKYGLWLEDIVSTKGKNTNWVHLDIGVRSDRPVRVFKV